MGMDVILCSNLPEAVRQAETQSFENKEDSHDWSRTFCNLLCRKEAVAGEIPKLDQLGALTHLKTQRLCDLELFATDRLSDMLRKN